MTTIITMHMVMMGTSWNFGIPKCNGSTIAAHGAAATFSKCMTPRTAARTAPATMPSSTATLATKPAPHLIRPRITSSTNSAMPSPCNWP